MNLNILSVLKSVPLDLNIFFEEISKGILSITPTENFDLFSIECTLNKWGINLPYLYAELLINILFIILCFLILLVAMIKCKEKKKDNFQKFP